MSQSQWKDHSHSRRQGLNVASNLRKHHYSAIISIFSIIVCLICGIAACTSGVVKYGLTIFSTEGGEVTTPGEGVFTYDEGALVNLVAEAEEGYYFVKWTGDVITVDDVNSIETTVTINDDYAITANFVPDGAEPVWDWYDLDAIRGNLGGAYVLMNNLDSTSPGYTELASSTANEREGWQPIGNTDEPFNGSFDGQEYEIGDMHINHPGELETGLFGFAGEGSVIRNVGVTDANITGGFEVGTLAGYSHGAAVSNCHATGSIIGDTDVGGLVGTNYEGTIRTSYCTCSVNCTVGFEGSAFGGLVGTSAGINGTISNCCATGSISGELGVGGLVGMMAGIICDSYSTGNVTGGSDVGGLVGYSEGSVSGSYSTGSVTGSTNVGGLVGQGQPSDVTDSFWDIQTSGQSTSAGGTGKTTAETQDITTFSGASWDIITVADPDIRNSAYIWNIVDGETYPFLSWQPV
jgi:hypothetical protein